MEICDLHGKIQESLDTHNVFIGKADTKLTSLCKQIDELTDIAKTNRKNIIEIKTGIAESKNLSRNRYDERKKSEERVPGFAGSLNRAFNKLRDEIAFYILVGGSFLMAWVFLQELLVKIGWRKYF